MTDPNETQIGGEHYKKYPIQPWDLLIDDNIPWAEGCIIEYVIRWRDKGGLQDLEKARHLIDKLIARSSRFSVASHAPGDTAVTEDSYMSLLDVAKKAAEGPYNPKMVDRLMPKMEPLYPPHCDCERCSAE